MGLAIARSIAELHKGDITVRSNEKETVFTIALPQHKNCKVVSISFICRNF